MIIFITNNTISALFYYLQTKNLRTELSLWAHFAPPTSSKHDICLTNSRQDSSINLWNKNKI